MKRKTSTTPTRVYSYGCLPPTAGADLVEEQIRLAHRYRNKLVEIERKRREIVQQAQAEIGDICALRVAAETLKAEKETAVAALKAKKAGKGKHAETTTEAAVVRALKQRCSEAWAALKVEKERQKGDGRLALFYAWISAEAHEAVRQARGASGLRHGNYSWVEDAAKQAAQSKDPPRFLRYTGEGVVRT